MRPATRPSTGARARRPRAAPPRAAALSASSAPSPSGWPMSWMPIGRPRLLVVVERDADRGRAGEVGDGGERREVGRARRSPTSGRPRRRCRSSPSGTRQLGERRAEHRVVLRRPLHDRARDALQHHLDAEVGRRVDALARPRTAPSSAARCPRASARGPAICAPNAVCVEIIGAQSDAELLEQARGSATADRPRSPRGRGRAAARRPRASASSDARLDGRRCRPA